jgi:Protein of unknown function (DUF998)
MTGSLLLAALSLAATLAYLAIFAAWHVLPTGYDPIRHAVSDYAVGRCGYLFAIGLWTSSAGVLALAFALIAGVGAPPLATRDLVFLFLLPVARVGMTLFPTDLEGKPLSRTGVTHYVLAIAAFTLTYLVISDTTSVLRHLGPAAWLGSSLRWSAWAVAPELALVVVTMVRPLRRVFGLFERLFLLTTNVWFVLVAVLLITRAT